VLEIILESNIQLHLKKCDILKIERDSHQ
jgi:hypothetical protein